MSLDDFAPIESSEWGSNSAEVSEKFKESFKKASWGIKKTKKDEKKAKKYDLLLAKFLVEMIIKKKYDTLLEYLFICREKWYGTNFLLGILSLAYMPISKEIRNIAKKPAIKFHYDIPTEKVAFHDNHLDDQLKMRINAWIEDIEDVISIDPSLLTSEQTLENLKTDDSIIDFTREIFSFFLSELHIDISAAKAESYARFIVWELEKTLLKIDLKELNF